MCCAYVLYVKICFCILYPMLDKTMGELGQDSITRKEKTKRIQENSRFVMNRSLRIRNSRVLFPRICRRFNSNVPTVHMSINRIEAFASLR